MNMKKILSIIFISVLVIILGLIWYYIYLSKDLESTSVLKQEKASEINEDAVILSDKELQALIEDTTPVEGAEPTLSEAELQALIEATSPADGAEATLSDEEIEAFFAGELEPGN